jgi:small glutamine-rich tetratricopeptide repeat-containing protein alpha
LSTSLKDGTLKPDDTESVEVASSCIADAFNVDPNDKAAMQEAVGTQNLHSIYRVYEKLKGRSTASTTGESSAQEGRPSTPSVPKGEGSDAPPPVTKPNPDAEKLKSAGNAAMQQKDYKTAIAKYTEAISMSPANPIYLSNRAAAYSASSDHTAAAADAEIAVAADPKYTKAWSRLGLAKFALGDARGSAEAYQKGIEFEGNGGSEAMRKGLETAKKRVTEMEKEEKEEENMPEDDVDGAPGTTRGTGGAGGMPDLSSLAGMFGGGAGGGGGMPDLGSLMNNPMFAGMARNLMQNPEALQGLMNNPRLQQMVQGMQGGGGGDGGGRGGGGGGTAGGGGMPDLSSMMNDPNIANL